jgi:hypothetical protein
VGTKDTSNPGLETAELLLTDGSLDYLGKHGYVYEYETNRERKEKEGMTGVISTLDWLIYRLCIYTSGFHELGHWPVF